MNWDRGSEWEGTDNRVGTDCAGTDCAGMDCAGTDCTGTDCTGTDCAGTDCAGTDCTGTNCAGNGLCWDEAYGMVASSCRCIGYIMVLREK